MADEGQVELTEQQKREKEQEQQERMRQLLDQLPADLFVTAELERLGISELSFESGKEAPLHIRVHNGWHKPITVFSLSSFMQDGDVPRNLTAQRLWVDLETGEEATLRYNVNLPVDPRQINLGVTVDFTDELQAKWFKKAAFNETVTVVPASESGLSLGEIASNIGAYGFLAGIVVLAYLAFFGSRKKISVKK